MKINYYKETYDSREAWLSHRAIGGSSASAIVGLNKHSNALDLVYKIKHPAEVKEDNTPLQLNEYNPIKYGQEIEPLLRNIVKLNFKQIGIETSYKKNTIYFRSDKPYMSASLDGTLKVKAENSYNLKVGEKGILELKTKDIKNRSDLDEWEGGIPNNYLIQVLHYLLVLNDYSFCFLVAKLRFYNFNEIDNWTFSREEIRYYFIRREDFIERLKRLEKKETGFYNKYILNNNIPEF